MKQIIPILQVVIGNDNFQSVDARNLHTFLDVQTPFSMLIKRRIEEYGFTQDVDFTASQNCEASETVTYGQGRIDYFLTLDMAKELAMVERTAKGKEARQYFIACEKELREQSKQPTELPYHIRRYLENATNVPKGHFAILPEMCNRLIMPLDRAGYHLPENMLPDISFGIMFCKHVRDVHGYDTKKLPKYKHVYEDGRVVKPKAYTNSLYAIAIAFLDDVWMPTHSDKYFRTRDENVLPYLQKVFGVLVYEKK